MSNKPASPMKFHIEGDELVQTRPGGRMSRCSFDDKEELLRYIVALDEELWACRAVLVEHTNRLESVSELAQQIVKKIG